MITDLKSKAEVPGRSGALPVFFGNLKEKEVRE